MYVIDRKVLEPGEDPRRLPAKTSLWVCSHQARADPSHIKRDLGMTWLYSTRCFAVSWFRPASVSGPLRPGTMAKYGGRSTATVMPLAQDQDAEHDRDHWQQVRSTVEATVAPSLVMIW